MRRPSDDPNTHASRPRSSPSPASRRVWALALGALLAVAAGGLAWRWLREKNAPAGLDRDAVAQLLAQRSATASPPESPADSFVRRPEGRRWYVPPEEAATIFEVLTRVNRYDPWCYYAHKPDYVHEVEWPEHPRGRWTYRTNASGLRNDAEVRSDRPDLRVLVTGDSHTDGFCDNADSYSGRLQTALARRAGRSVEVLNAANLAYSFHNYLGVLEKHLELQPDVFVVAVHGGNDFREVLLPYRYFERLPLPPKDAGERAPDDSGEDIFVPASHQGLLSVLRFRDQPEEKVLALRAAVEVMTEMRNTCDKHGIALICLYLPSPIEVERHRLADLVEPTMRALGLTEGDFAAHTAMARDFLREVGALGIEVLDTTDALRATGSPCYWREDLHLNLLGHETVARLLDPVVAHLAGWKH